VKESRAGREPAVVRPKARLAALLGWATTVIMALAVVALFVFG
jgi:hypothetical protein